MGIRRDQFRPGGIKWVKTFGLGPSTGLVYLGMACGRRGLYRVSGWAASKTNGMALTRWRHRPFAARLAWGCRGWKVDWFEACLCTTRR